MIESFDKDLELVINEKVVNKSIGNVFKEIYNKLPAGPMPCEKNVAEIIKDIRRGKNVC